LEVFVVRQFVEADGDFETPIDSEERAHGSGNAAEAQAAPADADLDQQEPPVEAVLPAGERSAGPAEQPRPQPKAAQTPAPDQPGESDGDEVWSLPEDYAERNFDDAMRERYRESTQQQEEAGERFWEGYYTDSQLEDLYAYLWSPSTFEAHVLKVNERLGRPRTEEQVRAYVAEARPRIFREMRLGSLSFGPWTPGEKLDSVVPITSRPSGGKG
jgi:hypothetical protein